MADYSNLKSIMFENRNGVGVLTLNRPDQMNAFTHEMHVEFEDAMLEISEDKADTRCRPDRSWPRVLRRRRSR